MFAVCALQKYEKLLRAQAEQQQQQLQQRAAAVAGSSKAGAAAAAAGRPSGLAQGGKENVTQQ
jgi:hypothetical protein